MVKNKNINRVKVPNKELQVNLNILNIGIKEKDTKMSIDKTKVIVIREDKIIQIYKQVETEENRLIISKT